MASWPFVRATEDVGAVVERWIVVPLAHKTYFSCPLSLALNPGTFDNRNFRHSSML